MIQSPLVKMQFHSYNWQMFSFWSQISPQRIGFLQILLSGAMFSFIGVVGKIAFERGIEPMEMLGFRFLFSSGLLALWMMARDPSLLKVNFKQLLTFAVLGICGYSMLAWSFFKALKTLSASLTVLLLYTYPIIVAVVGHFILKERISPAKLPWFIFALIGLVMLVWGEFEVKSVIGIGFGLLAALAYALYILASKVYLKEVSGLQAVFYIQAISALFFLSLSYQSLDRWSGIVGHSWGLMLFFALVCTLGAMLLFLEGLKKIKSWEASILSLSEPVCGVLVSVIILHESLRVWQLAGGALVLICLAAIARPSAYRE